MLKHIELNIGKACNNKCIFCMSGKALPGMMKLVDLEIVKKKLEKYASEGFNSVGYLGGDISIHPKMIDIIAFSKQLGFKRINIITNGMLFSNYEFARKIIVAGATRVNFSIHSHLPGVEDYITKIPGGLEKKFKAINNFQALQKEGLLQNNLSMNLVLNKLNLDSISETVLFFAKEKGINDIRINFIWLSDTNGILENWKEMAITYSEFIPHLKKLIFISLKYKIRITFDTVPPCIFYQVDENKGKELVKIFLGEQFDYINQIDHMNTNNQTEKFQWKERKKNTLKTQFYNCKKCIYSDSCEGVWKEYDTIYGGEEFFPIIDNKIPLSCK